jgi:uncharacterized membrane protein
MTYMNLGLLSFEGVRQAKNMHPLFVHFPLALIPTSFCFYGIGIVKGRRDFAFAGRAILLLAFISTMLAFFTGFRAETTLGISVPQGTLLRSHLACGSALMAMTVLLFAWSSANIDHLPRGRPIFLALLGLAAALTMVTGDLGAQMVLLRGASVSCPAPGVHPGVVR